MSGGVSVLADRYRQEPMDALGYDRWQDGEGLLDASDACRKAWKQFGPEWRAARAVDAGRVSAQSAKGELEDGLTQWERYGLTRVQEWGAWFGVCPKPRNLNRPSTPSNLIGAGFRWRERMIRADNDLLEGMWRLFNGERLALVAGSLQREGAHVRRQSVRASGWMVAELQS